MMVSRIFNALPDDGMMSNPHALNGTQSLLGESPYWHPAQKALYWIDIQGQAVRRLSFVDGQQALWELPSEPGCIAPCRNGDIVVALRDGIYALTPESGALRLLVAACHDTVNYRFNDGRCDSKGRLWVGNLFAPKTAESASLWCVQKQGDHYTLTQAVAGNITANGLAFSPDYSTMYWGHTADHRVDRFDFDLNSGVASHRSPWIQFDKQVAAMPYQGRPDGATVDVEGNYWVAMYEGSAVLKINPQGQVLGRIELPVPCVTMPVLGGEGLQTLFITTAQRTAPPGGTPHPDAGKVFCCRVDVPGMPVEFFDL